MIEFRHLRYFVAVAEELHFGRAAERLHMAQPPLSQQIRQLEEQLGFQLFHRTKRRVTLTEAGQVFLEHSQDLLQQLERAVESGRQASRGEVGQLAIGFVSSATYNVLPMILHEFRDRFPQVNLTLRELTTDQQVRWLAENRLDVGFIRPPIDDAQLKTQVILQEPLVVALPVHHPLAALEAIPLKSLAGESFILFPRRLAPGLYDQVISLCQSADFSPKVVQEAIQMQTIVSLVAARMGVAIVPISIQHLGRTGVVYRPLQEATPQAAIALLWHPDKLTPVSQQFLDMVHRLTH
ncbi:MAG TPA: LysR family transcriptional regulator [Candidatus Obscuribacterales bacterium]